MAVIPRKLHTKYELNGTQDERVIKHNTHYRCHCYQVTIAMRYVANVYYHKELYSRSGLNTV